MLVSLRTVVRVAIGAVLVCSCATTETKVELRDPVVMPQPELFGDVSEYVRARLPDKRFLAKDDYEPETYGYFREQIRWALTGDFDGNGIEDTAALMADESGTVSLVVFHRSKNGIRHYVLENDLGQLPIRNTLSLQPADWTWVSHADDDNAKPKKLERPGIVEDLLETCYTMLFYWEHGRYHSVYRGV